ncbi:MAG TPA: flagellar basal body-associated protein FliL, partial [Pseudolabrys sp.]
MAGKTKKKAEADVAEADSETDAKPKSKFSRKTILMAVAGLLVIGCGGAGGYAYFGHPAKEEKPKEAVVKPATFVDLPDVLVNLANSGSDRTQYLKVKVVLE